MARIKRFGILKMASFMGLYSVFIGLIFALLAGMLFSMIFGGVPNDSDIGVGSVANVVDTSQFFNFNLFNLILFPLIFGAMGFVTGLILTPIINLTLKAIKGIDLDIDFSDYSQTTPQVYRSPPPSPSQYPPQQSKY